MSVEFNCERPFPPLDPEESNMRAFAAAVLCQLVTDWMMLIKYGRTNAKYNFEEMRNFLTNGIGPDLCTVINIDSDAILEKLERDLYNFREHGIMPPKYNLRHDTAKGSNQYKKRNDI